MNHTTHIGRDIDYAIRLLEQGEVVAIPTETVYGLAGNTYSEVAIQKIFTVKGRPSYNPLIVHTYDPSEIEQFANNVPQLAYDIFTELSPGPITIILPKKNAIPDIVTGNLETVAIRIPDHDLSLHLLRNIPFPLAAPSANKFMSISPTTPQHVMKQLGGTIPYIIDGGPCVKGIESTVIGIVDTKIMIYRLGSITYSDLSRFSDDIEEVTDNKILTSPGMMRHHYAPITPLILVDDLNKIPTWINTQNSGLLCYHHNNSALNFKSIKKLSVNIHFEEASQNLYKSLYELDAEDLDYIVAQKLPNDGIGKAINDRLIRAAAK